MRTHRGAFHAVALLALCIWLLPENAIAVYECGGERDDCNCGRDNFCICCDGTCANCVWHAWHMACCNWGRALEWCTDAQYWNDRAQDNGYPTGGDPCDNSIFVCEPSDACSGWGHVGWVVTAHPDGSFNSTEQFCGGQCGTHERTRPAGFATGGFIYNPDGGCRPFERDDAEFVSETIPDGTHFNTGAQFVKRWTMRNSGTTTWTRAGNYLWTHDGDELFGAEEQTLLPEGVSVAPGNTYDWDVPMTAPSAAGTYRGYWKMDRFGTGRFGIRVWVEIVVDPVKDGDSDGYDQQNDCNDSDPAIHPGAVEICNGLDDNCDNSTDEGVKNRCGGCGPEPEEVYDQRDNDCDGLTDEGFAAPDAGPDAAADAGPLLHDAAQAADDQGGAGEAIGGGCSCRQGGNGAVNSICGLLVLLICGTAFRRRMF